MAFVSSLTPSTFVGAGADLSSKSHVATSLHLNTEPTDAAATTMRFGLGKTISKYINASQRIAVVPLAVSPNTSRVWNKFAALMNRSSTGNEVSYKQMMESIRNMARMTLLPRASPEVTAADRYMAGCVTRQYQQSGSSMGVYNVRCTEGTTKSQAEDSRVASLSAEFRKKQRSAVEKYGEKFEMRRRAIANSHECSHEEKQFSDYNGTAGAYVAAGAEAIGACSRLAVGASPAEDYMINSVVQQCKSRVVPYGVYGVTCSDGASKDMAEFRRVTALSAKFRSGQWSKIGAAQRKYDSSKYARDNFAHMCSYEENLFNLHPDMAASMSGPGAKY